MAITAADVNKLRQQTGAGMMDCKKALEESNGDFEAAVDFLRKKGAKVAANRQDRDAKEGVVLAKTSDDKKSAVVISVASTGFCFCGIAEEAPRPGGPGSTTSRISVRVSTMPASRVSSMA